MSVEVDVSEDPNEFGVSVEHQNLSDWSINVSDAVLILSDKQAWQLWEAMKEVFGDEEAQPTNGNTNVVNRPSRMKLPMSSR